MSDPIRAFPPWRALLPVALVAGIAGSAATLAVVRLLGAEPPPPLGEIVSPAPSGPAPEERATADGAASSSERDDPDERGTDDIAAALATAEAERSQLAGTVLALNRRGETMERRLESLAARLESIDARGDEDEEGALPLGEVGEIIVSGEAAADDGASAADGSSDGRDDLLAAGLDPQSAADIRRRRDRFELERLALLDRATREGWRESERFGEELERLEETRPDMREELGDEAYDRYLYERGDSNRVGIASVLGGSAAESAGIEVGDLVLSYDGSRVFRARELQAATRAGNLGEYVQLGVRRGEQLLGIDVPRGPMGVTLRGVRRAPG